MDMANSHGPEKKDHMAIDNQTQTGPPHEAMYLVLSYLPLYELLAMNQVCRSLRDAVTNDVLPWLNIIVKRPLNLKLSDDILIKVSSKASGQLRNLALLNCIKITDDGLQRVIEKNPHISKLYIPSCTALTPDGVIRAVKILTENNHNALSLKINGIYNIKKEHLKILHSYLDMNPRSKHQQKKQCSLYLQFKNFSTFQGDENNCPIDVDICPKCDEVRMVFECTRDTCESKRQHKLNECRGCYLCIPRCEECGKCIELEDVGEAACADILCSDCWLKLPKCNYCNRPYCKQHIDEQCSLPGSSGFVCGFCHVKFINSISN